MKIFKNSESHLERAERVIPLGSQTFSKSRTQYPVGISPLFIDKAKGAHVWDLDGNKYIDLVSSLASITLGYGDGEVNQAVIKQLRKGVSFSLPGMLEAEVAEIICELVPSAEMVRFGKNGTDATSAAVRLARAYTGKDRVLVCGYHGWQDWYIGSTSRNKGVPKSVSNLTESFQYNDFHSLAKLLNSNSDIACVVMEPMNSTYPQQGFLENVREITTRLGVVLIFDETITGFRFSEGGAQELFGVTPDLSTFGKGIANGFPLSAIVGRREIMTEMKEIFFSGTFGGELLSLAAAKVVLQMHLRKAITPRLFKIGHDLSEKVLHLIESHGLGNILSLTGHPSWKFINWEQIEGIDQNVLRTFFMQEMIQNGVLLINTHNVNLGLKPKHIEKITQSYENTLVELKKGISSKNLEKKLRAKPLVPLFKVR